MVKAGVADNALLEAVSEMAQGLVDAELGGHVVKKRVALPGRGKRGGAGTIVATNHGRCWFFLYGFAKNERADIDKNELEALQQVAAELIGFDDHRLAIALAAGEIMEVCRDHDQT